MIKASVKIRISESELSGERYKMCKIHMIEDTTQQALGGEYPKYLQDIIMHALTLSRGVRIESNERFTYRFPLKLS